MPYDITKDRFPGPIDNGGCPGKGEVIAPSDTTDVSPYYDNIYVGVSGDITCIPARNSADVGILYKSVPIGFFPVAVRRVLVTGTTATNMIGHRY